MLNYEFPPLGGGGGNAHLSILKEYARIDGIRVDVLTSSDKLGLTVDRFAENINIYKVGVHKKDLHFWRKSEVIEWLIKGSFHYRRLIRKNDYDVAHAFFGFPTGLLCYRNAHKMPYIISLRGSDVPGINPRLGLDYKLLAPVFRRIWRNASALIACSSGLRRQAQRFLPDAEIGVIHNGVDASRFNQSQQKHDSLKLRLLTASRLAPAKRIDLLISAVAHANKKCPGITLTIAGGGAGEQELRQIIDQNNLHGFVTILGRVSADEMPRLYQEHDMYVSATSLEGMSNAMLEAMASGLPVVTTVCEGSDELISDNGVVVEEAEAGAIAKEIITLFHDREKYVRMCEASRKKASTFRWDNLANQYLGIYGDVICAKGDQLCVG